MTQIKTTPDGRYICPHCGNDYAGIAQHWTKAQDCAYPDPSSTAQDVFVGLYLAEAAIEDQSQGTNPLMRRTSVTETALEWLCEQLGFWCVDVSDTGDSPDVRREAIKEHFGYEPDELETQYRLTTRSTPYIDEVRGTRYPDLPFSALIGRILFAFKGSLRDRSAIAFRVTRGDELVDYLHTHGFADISLYPSPEGKHYQAVVLSAGDTREFFDRIGHEPLPGFESKWQTLRDEGEWQGRIPTHRVYTDGETDES